MLHSIGHGLLIFFMVLGLIVFRLLWPSPLTDKLALRYLPKKWYDWLLDNRHSPAR